VALRKGSDVDIAAAYQRAKRNDPTITQGQYAVRAYPTISERYRHATTDAERRRIELSGARYHRLVLAGQRSGRVNIERGAAVRTGGSVDLFQVFIPVSGQKEWVSFDLTGIGAKSTFDIPSIEAQLRNNPDILARKAAQFARRYDLQRSDLHAEAFEIRRVTRHRKRAERIVIAQ
jgi:hypothetical protein